ncbi:C39 family peptidase [Helicobacter cappadocius]|uniref:C39 family peptidase n=1 Tax=Helicobacter cappadocius TaxID=3063998 RepID=A0AA90PVW9_9HELI|nr:MULTISPECIES: C39 family peptidase [unclassified Helicobacter]MDO7253340.1 C39 family peptidase [Helicobacter sp. faydin-H75]MDP2539230.1 C39 family peptidase [Helicobacter sp. faydin-H76]
MKKFIFLVFLGVLNAQVYINQNGILIERSVKSWIEFRNANLVRQKYDYSCGSASLASILKYYYEDSSITERIIIDEILKSKGYDVNQNEVLKEGDNIISFLDLSKYAIGKGFKAIGLAVDFDTLSKLKIPVIVFVSIRSIDHFTVYKGMDEEYVYLADPSFGNIKIKIDQFKEMFFQRKDSKYPGKILAILPQKQDTPINKDFMKIKKDSGFTYRLINQDLIHHRFR